MLGLIVTSALATAALVTLVVLGIRWFKGLALAAALVGAFVVTTAAVWALSGEDSITGHLSAGSELAWSIRVE